MAVLLSDNTLNSLCLFTIENAKYYTISMYEICLFMYHNGCRVTEVTDRGNLIFIDENNCSIITKKNNHIRHVTLKYSFPFLRNYHNINISDISAPANITIKNFVTKCIDMYGIEVINRKVSSRIFRYNYMRALYASGLSIQEMKDHIGHIDIKNTSAYIAPIFIID